MAVSSNFTRQSGVIFDHGLLCLWTWHAVFHPNKAIWRLTYCSREREFPGFAFPPDGRASYSQCTFSGGGGGSGNLIFST